MTNPYLNINWGTVMYVPSVTHAHCRKQVELNKLVDGGIMHVALSNYYPSAPTYPLSDYFSVPEGVIGSPNAEQHNISPYSAFHCNGVGSTFSAGSPSGESPVGMNGASWRYTFQQILANLQYSDGGGVTINHPHWTRWSSESPHPTNNEICEMLDYDSRVLGIEFYNASSERNNNLGVGWDLDTWDGILKTGRRCWGFCVPDHDAQVLNEGYVWEGRNILLVSEFTEHECLKAYREGRFYGALRNTDLIFDSISYSNNVLSVAASNADYIDIVVDGVYNRVNSNSTTYSIPSQAVYVRVEAHNSENSIYSNPIILKEFSNIMSTAKKMLVLN